MELNDHALRGDVDDLCTHDAAELDQGTAVCRRVGDLDEHHLEKDAAVLFKAAHLDHVKLFV